MSTHIGHSTRLAPRKLTVAAQRAGQYGIDNFIETNGASTVSVKLATPQLIDDNPLETGRAARRPPLLPSFSAALQHFPPTDPTHRTRIGSRPSHARGGSGDTLTWDLDLMMQQMNH